MVFVTSTFHLLFIRQLLVAPSSPSTQHSILSQLQRHGQAKDFGEGCDIPAPSHLNSNKKKRKATGKAMLLILPRRTWSWSGIGLDSVYSSY
ncbi:hypothetical protein BJX62DRAFT_180543 [Aspergillus germanicus]